MQAVEYPPHQKDFDVDLPDALLDMQGFLSRRLEPR